MRHNLEEWKSLGIPPMRTEQELNDWQAQIISDAIADITELSKERETTEADNIRLHDEIKLFRVEIGALRTAREEAEAKRDEYKHLFDLQQKRMTEATKLWQWATGKHDVLPDLGDLLNWLMIRARMNHTTREAKLEAECDILREQYSMALEDGEKSEAVRQALAEIRCKEKSNYEK